MQSFSCFPLYKCSIMFMIFQENWIDVSVIYLTVCKIMKMCLAEDLNVRLYVATLVEDISIILYFP